MAIVFETRMSKRMQSDFIDKPVYRAFVNTEERALLKEGQSVTRPYKGLVRAQDYTRGADVSIPDIEETNETLTVQTIKATPFGVSGFDQLQSNFNTIAEWSNVATDYLKQVIDGDILGEVANANNTVDDSDFDGTSGDPISLDTSNVLTIFTTVNRKLREAGVDITGKDPRVAMAQRGVAGVAGGAGFSVLSPYFLSVLEDALLGRETPEGDRIGINGYVNKRGSLELFASNHTYWSAVLGIATTPTDGDTLTIGGVTLTAKTVLGSTAGNVLIGGSADAFAANVAALINAPGTTTANGVALSNTRPNTYTRSDREKIEDLTATADATANTVTLTCKTGYSYYVLSSSLTDATDGWAKETSHLLAGRKGCVDMVAQIEPTVEVSDVPKKINHKYIKPYSLYGKKTFLEGATRMVDIKINTANLT